MAHLTFPSRNRRNFLQLGLASGVVALAASPLSAQENEMPAALRQALEREQLGAVLGNPAGDITLTEFFDYNCPYCRSMVADLHQVIADDPGLRVVLREWPVFGAGSLYCARASLASLRQGRFRQFHTALLAIKGQADDKSAMRVAAQVGLDITRLRADMEDVALARQIEHSWILAEQMGLVGTPSLIVGNLGGVGKQTAGEMRRMIQEARRSGT
ncbi:DsbA family protein [Paracoccus ravus]|uniref:DsbA family protein n=1 Tax=Paracoccus ravus TaxID=2447760 RepID=UPI00106EE1C4|nr:DsbA family protein [Paracoccus ravus]